MQRILRPALTLFLLLSLLCGVAYPLAITGISHVFFPFQARGSLINSGATDSPAGSRLIGQFFSSPKYFWGRPSATGPMPNNASASSGSNQTLLNPALMDAVKSRIAALKTADPHNTAPIPVDLVTASASGLDPDISLAAAYYQVARVARVRKLEPDAVRLLIERQKTVMQLGFLGEPTVNVLMLNIALDKVQAQ